MQGDVAVTIVLMVMCIAVNFLALIALSQVKRRNRLPKSEKSLLYAITACGIGTGIFCLLPTFFVPSDAGKENPSPHCEIFGMMGAICMSASSWFGALLSFNRYFILTRSFRNRPMTSQWRLFAVHFGVWIFTATVYVTMYFLVNAGVGVPKLHATAPLVSENSTGSYVMTSSIPPIVAQSFIVVDLRSGIRCSPNWRFLLHYLIAASILFYALPLCVVIMSYLLIIRIAYSHVKNIRKLTLRSSDDSVTKQSVAQPSGNISALIDQQEQPQIPTVSGASEMVQGYTRPLLYFRQMMRERSLRRNTKTRRRKATIIFIIAISLFVFSWTPYYAYFLTESVSYHSYNATSSEEWLPPFNRSSSIFLTCSVVIGRTWSILAIAMLNRPYRRTIFSLLRQAKHGLVGCCYRITGKSRIEVLNVESRFSVSHVSRPTYFTHVNTAYMNEGDDEPIDVNYRSSLLSNQLSENGHRSSFLSNQRSESGHRSSFLSNQLSESGHRSSFLSNQLSENGHRSSFLSDQISVESRRSSVLSHQLQLPGQPILKKSQRGESRKSKGENRRVKISVAEQDRRAANLDEADARFRIILESPGDWL